MWTMPNEPGPEVTAVRDCRNVRWGREGDLWSGEIGHTDEGGNSYAVYRAWHELLKRGPLTNATNGERS
jgi:hypothetical protein